MPAKPKGKKQEPEQQPAAQPEPAQASATVKALVGDFKGVETFKAQTGTTYGVIAEAKGLTLSIAPKIAPTAGFIGIFTRVRIQKKEDWSNLNEGGALFGFPEVQEKSSRHASCEAFVAVALQPTTPYDVGKAIEANCILESLVAAIQKRVEGAGQKLAVSPEAIVMYLRNVFETVLPTEAPKQITEFPVCIGDAAISAHSQALFEKFGPKKKPKHHPEHPPGAEGLNPD